MIDPFVFFVLSLKGPAFIHKDHTLVRAKLLYHRQKRIRKLIGNFEQRLLDEDDQTSAIQCKTSTSGITARQPHDGRLNNYTENVRPAQADLKNENPGATAIATGTRGVVQCVCSLVEYIAAFAILAMHWGALI